MPKSSPVDLIAVNKCLDAFIEKMFVWPVENSQWSFQTYRPGKKDIDFFPVGRSMTREDLLNHFSQEPLPGNYGSWIGSLGVRPTFPNDKIKWWCVDMDDDCQYDMVFKKLLPTCERMGIETIVEYAGKNYDRFHIWGLCDTTLSTFNIWFKILLDEAGIKDTWRDLPKVLEFYPYSKAQNLIRFPAGAHLRTGIVDEGDDKYRFDRTLCYANPIKFRGKAISESHKIMKAFIDCESVSYKQMLDLIKAKAPRGVLFEDDNGKKEQTVRYREKPLVIRERDDLKLPKDPLYKKAPETVHTLWTQCQARSILVHEVEAGKLNDYGEDIHKLGLMFAGELIHAARIAKEEDKKNAAYDFAQEFYAEKRWRDHEGHNWLREENEEHAYPWRCETMHTTFGLCDAAKGRKRCPFYEMNGFRNAIQVHYGDKLEEPAWGKEVKTDTAENIAQEAYSEQEKLVLKELRAVKKETDNGEISKFRNIVVTTPQGTFKSSNADYLAAKLSKAGYKVLLAVPTGAVASEHIQRLKKHGANAFACRSHLALFPEDKDLTGHPCPRRDEIQEMVDLGISSSLIKREHCRGCEYLDACPYPRMYQNSVESDQNITIIQHAHLSSKDAMRIILRKEYDILIVDETFIDSVMKYMRVTSLHLRVLKRFTKVHTDAQWPWLIIKWLSGKRITDRIEPDKEDLKALKKMANRNSCSWIFPEIIRNINDGRRYDKKEGLFVFSPLPNQIKVRVFTDATPPLGFLRKILDKKPKVIGGDKLVDVKKYNPKNEMIKVIDGTTSKTANEDPEFVRQNLTFIGLKMQSKRFEKLTCMVTVYKNQVKSTKEFFEKNFPDVYSRMTVSSMTIGVNAYKDINVQFLLAGVHLHSSQILKARGQILAIENYWDAVHGREPSHHKCIYGKGVLTEFKPLKMFLRIKHNDGRRQYRLVEFRQTDKNGKYLFGSSIPTDYYNYLTESTAVGRTQQALRLRYHDDALKITYDFSNRFSPNIAYTKAVMRAELMAQYGLGQEIILGEEDDYIDDEDEY